MREKENGRLGNAENWGESTETLKPKNSLQDLINIKDAHQLKLTMRGLS